MNLVEDVVSLEGDEEKEDRDDDVKTVVFIYSSDTVMMREVEIGIQDDEFIQITDGLKGEEEVVVGPYQAVARDLESGEKVKRVKEDELYSVKKK